MQQKKKIGFMLVQQKKKIEFMLVQQKEESNIISPISLFEMVNDAFAELTNNSRTFHFLSFF